MGPPGLPCGVALVDWDRDNVRGWMQRLMSFIPSGLALDSQDLAERDAVSQVFEEQCVFFLTLVVILVLVVIAVHPGAEQPVSPGS